MNVTFHYTAVVHCPISSCTAHSLSYSLLLLSIFFFFFFNDTATTEIYTLSLHDALPICGIRDPVGHGRSARDRKATGHQAHIHRMDGACLSGQRSEEHTSELQSPCNLVCRLLLEKKKKKIITNSTVYERDISLHCSRALSYFVLHCSFAFLFFTAPLYFFFFFF